jgi:TonB family protein
MWKLSLAAACLSGIVATAQGALTTPPRLQSGAAPALPAPAAAVGGGQVFVELSISPAGAVTAITPLRTTPPFTQLLENAVRRWRFRPASATTVDDRGVRQAPRSIASKALVASHFRAPALRGPTLGEPPRDVASPSGDVPFPISTVEPPYPPNAHSSGVIVIEALVDATGAVAEATVTRSAPPFDAPALDAARQWRFRPASPEGRATAAYVYLIFGFRQPVIVGKG